ncbi:hypothetical protein JM658_14180 [Joostella atrarenae]|uniref:Uncharacterized protein n=1 Tax=Joostella atrarenae TaxID=679257 RepID=A0ABS9J6B3_9FLAO|nr:hypothetical protein [Joostella atrarenae]MCF8715981.1 hypothetical protein [Joostella atrarenae]
MNLAHKKQNFQDWITQQWVILFGKKVDEKHSEWLLGPFGNTNGIGIKFIDQLAEKEHLIKDKGDKNKGLIQSINQLNLSKEQLKVLSEEVIDFYENTANYDFDLNVKWNPFFKGFGILLKTIFSNRIEQLNIPIDNIKETEALKSEIIHLKDANTMEVKRTIWLRTFKKTNQVVYSGIYEACTLPSGKTCIKAIFPLPNGNATVILSPSVGDNGELVLDSSGKRIGDSGFYFLLNDAKGKLWTKFIKSFKDKLVVSPNNDRIIAIQTLTLWGIRVLVFQYNITKKYPSENLINK